MRKTGLDSLAPATGDGGECERPVGGAKKIHGSVKRERKSEERSVGRWKCNNKHYLSARGSLTMRMRREAARLVAKRKFFAIKSFRAV